jgi:hypothetical protein
VAGIRVVSVVEETIGGGRSVTVDVSIKVVGMEAVAVRVFGSDCIVTVRLSGDGVICSVMVEYSVVVGPEISVCSVMVEHTDVARQSRVAVIVAVDGNGH